MSLCLNESLQKLEKLSARELLGTARALEHLPRVSAAFQSGRLCWGKLRALKGLLTPETEKQWLEFALESTTAEVVSKVSASPREWKRYQALQASLEGEPIADRDQVQQVLTCSAAPENQRTVATHPVEPETVAVKPPVELKKSVDSPESPAADEPQTKVVEETKPQTIRVVIEMTPDQYALYERAESRARAKAGKRLSRGAAVTQMAKALLDQGSARERSRHQVVIHTDRDGLAWYETERGLLPVAPEVLEEACSHRDKIIHPLRCANAERWRSECLSFA